jgi:molybdate transport system substrate-binding protein
MRLFALLLATFVPLAHAAEVQVAVAANFAAPMKVLAAQFGQRTGHVARLSVGSTGKFYAQIRSGAPFEVLLAADDETPARLEREGQGSGRYTYAVGRLALWSRQAGLVDAAGRGPEKRALRRLAVADPKLAPYGAAAYAKPRQTRAARDVCVEGWCRARISRRRTSSSPAAMPNSVSSHLSRSRLTAS